MMFAGIGRPIQHRHDNIAMEDVQQETIVPDPINHVDDVIVGTQQPDVPAKTISSAATTSPAKESRQKSKQPLQKQQDNDLSFGENDLPGAQLQQQTPDYSELEPVEPLVGTSGIQNGGDGQKQPYDSSIVVGTPLSFMEPPKYPQISYEPVVAETPNPLKVNTNLQLPYYYPENTYETTTKSSQHYYPEPCNKCNYIHSNWNSIN